MRGSKVEVAVHLVWATYNRAPLLTGPVEEAVYALILREAKSLGCEVLAVGGMPDHIHAALVLPATISISDLVKRLKGSSSRMVTAEFGSQPFFKWQEGYAAFSFSRSHRTRIIDYVTNQKQHHADNETWLEWEETDVPVPGK